MANVTLEKDAHLKVQPCIESLELMRDKTKSVLGAVKESLATLNSDTVNEGLTELTDYLDKEIMPQYNSTLEHYEEMSKESRALEGV